jgi:hypothetical protein
MALRVVRQGVIASVLGLAMTGCGKKAEAPSGQAAATDTTSEAKPAGVDATVVADTTITAETRIAADTNIVAASDANIAAAGDANVAAPGDANVAAPSGPKGSLEATCTAIAAVTDAAFAKVEAQKKDANGQAHPEWPDLIPRAGIGACVKGAGGAYAIEVSDGAYRAGTGEIPGGQSTMRAKLVFVDAEGARTDLVFEPIDEVDGPNLGIGVAYGQWWTVEAVHDWNSDGTAEVALRRHHQSPDGAGSYLELYRLGADDDTKAPRLDRWLPLGDTGIQKVADEDGDGRLDLFSFAGFYRYVALGAEIPTTPEGVYHFHHARTDGTFESVGDAAKAYYRKACGPKFEVKDIQLAKDTTVEAAIGKAVCARLYGASVASIRKRIDPFLKKAFSIDELDEAEGWLAEVPVNLAE